MKGYKSIVTRQRETDENRQADAIATRIENEVRERMNNSEAAKEIEITAEELKSLFGNKKNEWS